MRCQDTDEAIKFLLSRVQGAVRVGTPLGLGKPNVLLNRLYGQMAKDASRKLEIFTALSLDPPRVQGFLAERLFKPFAERHFGANYPRLSYVNDLLLDKMPEHIRVHEFFLQAGLLKNNPRTQRDYISLNYTHAAAGLLDRGVNCLLQLVAKGPNGKYSLSCNPDITLDIVDLAKARGLPLTLIAVVHEELPYMGGSAEVGEDYFDLVLEGPEHQHKLFAVPRLPIEAADYFIGLHASQVPHDAGTLQIGIGSLSDALTYALVLRHTKNKTYRGLLGKIPALPSLLSSQNTPFTIGLYGMSEMLMDGFMHLRKAGVLIRKVKTAAHHHPRFMHGGFFLGSKEFYRWLRELSPEERNGISMTRISRINDLYDDNEPAVRAQRPNASFFNTAMQVSLLGETFSDTLPDGRVISGVGGQYNFAAMARELPDAHSSIMLRSTRKDGKKNISNVVMQSSNSTISRHLRDLVITEYGVAYLRGRTDEECAQGMIEIADAEFQEELLREAIKAKKISPNWKIPEKARENTAENLDHKMAAFKKIEASLFPPCPFGSDFTELELKIFFALQFLKNAGPIEKLKSVLRGWSSPDFSEEMDLLELYGHLSVSEKLQKLALKGVLNLNRPPSLVI